MMLKLSGGEFHVLRIEQNALRTALSPMVSSTVPLTVHLQNLSLRAKEGCSAQHEAALHCHSSSGMYG